ncbi:MAG: RHS repeat-associated core domain-containing protein [Acidobacteriota bacterium]
MNRRLSHRLLARYLFPLWLFGLAITGLLVWQAPLPFTAAQTCTFTISPGSLNFDTGGGSGGILVTASQPSCTWSATPNVPWISITAGDNGTGTGTVVFAVAFNPATTSRTGTLTVAGQTFTVNQAAGLVGLQYFPLPQPVRLMDTRANQGNCDNIAAPINAGTSLTVQGRGTCESLIIPANAQALAGNITAINSTAQSGYLTLYPNGVSVPLAANMVYSPGQILSNAFTVSLSAAGEFNIFAERTIDAVVDIGGYYAPPGNGLFYHPLSRPVRLMDTRTDEGNCDNIAAPINAGASLTVQGRGTCENLMIPANAQALAGNITAINSTAQFGYLTLYPNGVSVPLAANMVYSPGQILSNAFTVSLSAAGEFNIFAERTIDAVVDIGGYFSPDAVDLNGQGLFFTPLARPVRLTDTRANEGNCDSLSAPINAGASLTIQGRGTCEGLMIPANAQALAGNITAINPNAQAGYLTLYPNGVSAPLAANMVYFPGQILSNAFTVSLSALGEFNVFAERTIDAVVDIGGYFAPPPANLSPLVVAGADQTITSPVTTANLIGMATDDGLPNGTLTVSWSKLSGPGTVTFSTPNLVATGAMFSGEGVYVLRLTANDGALTAGDDVQVTVNGALAVNAGSDQVVTLPNTAMLTGTVMGGAPPVTVEWSKVSGPGSVLFGNASATMTTAIFAVNGTYVLRLSATNTVGTLTDDVQVIVNADPTPPPPDPTIVAPPLNNTVATTIGTATEFLYTGGNPIQTGVAPGTINPVRAAVLKGRVLDKSNNPLPLVKITVLNHPEFGQTVSRADGRFDLAVNGGGVLTVQYEKAGFIPVQRTENVPWQDYYGVPDVVMIGYDPAVTLIDLSLTAPIQVAQGTASTDTSGTRRTTLMFKQGTTALMKLPGGAMAGLDKLHVRATEFTVGANGPNAMPGDLPGTSAYTYAAAYTLDEAVAANAIETTFSQPVIQYNENFLNFPAGTIIPSGAYDRQTGQWVPSGSGRVVKILSITGGTANLDVSGNGVPATDPEYAALDINTAERQQLATLYAVNQVLWRVPLIHFSPWDSNWPFGPPSDATSPPVLPPIGNNGCGCPTKKGGCIIEVENQTLGETAGVTGTPFSLNYRSSRQAGYKTAYTLAIPLSLATLPASVKRIEMEITIAGRVFTQTFPAAANQATSFTWDGKDAYGRTMQGKQSALVDIGYVYNGVYQNTANFGYNGNGIPITGSITRQEVTLHAKNNVLLGTYDTRSQILGGWSLSAHHVYDPIGRILYQGDGTRRSVETVNKIITTFAGTGVAGFSGDGGPANQAQLNGPGHAAVGPDGSVFIVDTQNKRIRKVAPNGIISTAVNLGPITNDLHGRIIIAPDGSFITDGNSYLIKIAPNGQVTTLAGIHGQAGFSGDGGPATQAKFRNVRPFLAADGSIYISDTGNYRIRKISTDGIVRTIAGNGTQGFSGDGGPATQASFYLPSDLVVTPDGTLYFLDHYNYRIRKVTPDGIISTIAGTGAAAYTGDGGPAALASVNFGGFFEFEAGFLGGLALGPDGSLYFTQTPTAFGQATLVRRIGPDGIITTVAGTNARGDAGDGGPAGQAQLTLLSVSIGPDGSLYIAGGDQGTSGGNKIRRITPPLPGYTASDIAIPSVDGTQLFMFDGAGRHLRTANTLTNTTIYTFAYDSAGRLSQITNGDGNITVVERNGAGNPTAVISPYGQRTTLTLNAAGSFASISDPLNQSSLFVYTGDGLITSETDPRGNQTQFTYNALGLLTRDDDPAGGFKTLARTELGYNDYSVLFKTALNRTLTARVQDLSTGDRRRVTIQPDGLQTELVEGKNGINTLHTPDGETETLMLGPDPRWQMQAPLISSDTIATPGGLNFAATFARSVALAVSSNPLSLTSQTDTLNVNGVNYTSAYTSANRTFNDTTPLGRQRTTVIDAQGRTTQQQFANLDPANYGYDARGRLNAATFSSGANARTFSLAYNANGFLASLTDALNRVTGFGYDSAGRVTQQTLPDARVIGFAYDANGNLTSLTPPGRPAHTFAYNAVDLLTSYTSPTVPGTGATQFAYNLDRQITTLTRPDALTLNFAYDTAGRLQTLTVPNGAYGFSYSGTTGNLSGITAPGSQTLSFAYDGALLTGTTWAGTVAGSVTYAFDNNFRIASQSVNGANTANFTYDNDSLLTGAGALAITRNAQNGLITGTTLNNVADARGYNGLAELTSYSASFNATPLYATTYTRDKLGRITQKIETVQGVTNTYDYTYDLAGRLSTVKLNTVTVATYAYDSNSNRASLTTGGTVTGTYDNQDRMTAYGAATHAYTANGELASKTVSAQTTSYSYDVVGNLRQVTLPGGTQIDYVIDGQNRRIGKRVNGVLTQGRLYQNSLKPVAELDGGNTLVSRFVYGSNQNTPDYLIKGGITYRLIADHLGSVRLVVDSTTGAIAQRIDYDEFGVVLMDTNPGFQPFGFAGGLYDSQTGFVRFGARDYDAQTGRWTAKDPILFSGGDTNLYGYVLADPVNNFDSSGLGPPIPTPGGVAGFTIDQFTDQIADAVRNGIKRCPNFGTPKDKANHIRMTGYTAVQGVQTASQAVNPTNQVGPILNGLGNTFNGFVNIGNSIGMGLYNAAVNALSN